MSGMKTNVLSEALLREIISNEIKSDEIKTDDMKMEAIIKEYIDKYKPIVYMICNEVLNVMSDFVANKEYYTLLAHNKRNMFNAYVNAGFTDEQAMALILNDNLQLVKAMQNVSGSTNKSKNK